MTPSTSHTPPKLLATIDIGTNSVLMQIAQAAEATPTLQVSCASVHVLSDRATITRLGRGVDRTKRLDDAAVARTLEVLREYAAAAHAASASIIAVGTSALRDAENASDFVRAAEQILGVPLEVISGQREAQLTYLGATAGLALGASELCVVDIGGGSTEIVHGRDEQVLASVSLDVGAVRLTERHGLTAPATATQLAALEAEITQTLAGSPVQPRSPLIAIAGSATTLAAILGEVEPYDPKRIHGARIPLAELSALAQRLAAMTLAERQAVRGLDRGRADVMVAGAMLLIGVAKIAQVHDIIVSNGGVRMGLAVAAFNQFRIDPTRGCE